MEDSSKGLRKGAWSAEEDNLLRQCVDKYGEGKWHQVPLRAGLNRCRKSCRLRWLNYLKPSIKKGKLACDEVDLLLRLHKLLGNRWSLIAGRLPGRTANDVKNYWNTHLSKKHEPSCKTKMNKRNITTYLTTPAQKIEVLKPRPRSFTVTNGSSHLVGLSETPCHGPNNTNGFENSITCNKDDETDELVKNLINGDNMWLDSFVEKSQEAGATAIEKGETLAFEVENLWSMFDGHTVELN